MLWFHFAAGPEILVTIDLRLAFYAAVGVVAGIFLFYRGFRMLQFKRLVLNTPFSKIRSASMGLVEVSGTAAGPQTIPAGITGTPCFYYCATAWELKESGKNREWKKVAEEKLYVPFFVEDPTGGLLVNPQGADLDVHRSFRDEFNSSPFGMGGSNIFPENVTKFLLRNGIGASGNIRLEERCIQPGYPLFVLGTLATNPDRGNWAAVPHVITPSSSIRMRSSFSLRFGNANTLLQTMTGIPTTAFGGATTRIPVASGLNAAPARAAVNTPNRQAAPAAGNWSSVSMDDEPAVQSAREAAATTSRTATVAAIAENPQQEMADEQTLPRNNGFDMHAPVALYKGTGDDPFTISSQSQREIVQALAWKSTACIWGGPLLTLISSYVLSRMFGW